MSTDAVPLKRADEAFVPAGDYKLSDRLGGVQHVDRFWLDRYPVTVDRYARFIDAGGYDEADYWDDEGSDWKRDKKIVLPRFWDEPAWKRYLRRGRPVVGVSYWEAIAFCHFEKRRLPSERELEAASRGAQGNTYTWGDAWEEGRLGVRGVGPRMTWPVGYFRRAVGPFGHYDLIGNVWQWTNDRVDEEDPESSRVVRGGSWASRPDQNRTDSWNAYEPGAQFSHLGFRTARRIQSS